MAKEKNAEYYFNKGINFFEKEQFQKAITNFQKAISLNNSVKEYYESIALCFYITEENKKAILAFEKLLSLDPNNIRAMTYLSEIYSVEEEFDKAEEILMNAFDKGNEILNLSYPDNINFYMDMSQICYKIEYFDAGIQIIYKGLLKFKNSFELHNELAVLYYESEMLEEAVIECDKTIELNSELSTAYLYKGLSYQKMNILNKAIENFKISLKLNSKQDDLKKLIEKLEELIKENGNTVEEIIADTKITKKYNGIVKWFDIESGIGFIKNDKYSDIFLHYSAINMKGIPLAFEGENVTLGIVSNNNENIAVSVERILPKERYSGIVEFFDKTTGEGEIKVSNFKETIFVHFSQIIDREIKILKVDEKVVFDIVEYDGEFHAYNIVNEDNEEKFFSKHSKNLTEEYITGIISMYDEDKGFGIIEVDDNSEYYFNKNGIIDIAESQIKENLKVQFKISFTESIDGSIVPKAIKIKNRE